MKKASTIAIATSLLASACAYWQETPAVKKTAAPAPVPTSVTTTTAAEAPPPPEPDRSEVVDIRLTGSNTLGSQLAPKLAHAWLASLGAKDVRDDESGRGALKVLVEGHVKDKLVRVTIAYPGSSAAFECLAQRQCEIGMASRQVRAEEAKKLEALGDMTGPDAEHVIGLDGIAVIVNKVNAVNALTAAQLKQLFHGDAKDWADLGGAPGEVHAYARPTTSGTFDAFQQLVMGQDKITAAPERTIEDSAALARAIVKDTGAIGFVGLPYVGDAKVVAVKDGDAAPIAPSPFAIATEDYPLTRRLFFYTAPTGRSALADDLVAFAMTDPGQKLVADTGFVPFEVAEAKTAPPPGSPKAFVRATRGAKRLSFTAHFKSGTAALDTKASADLDRTAKKLKADGSRAQVILVGHADTQGTPGTNIKLSRQRAQAVSAYLKKLGVATTVVEGVGSAMPVAPNDAPEGRERNRRVEVWVR